MECCVYGSEASFASKLTGSGENLYGACYHLIELTPEQIE
jgi:hypothetical protein